MRRRGDSPRVVGFDFGGPAAPAAPAAPVAAAAPVAPVAPGAPPPYTPEPVLAPEPALVGGGYPPPVVAPQALAGYLPPATAGVPPEPAPWEPSRWQPPAPIPLPQPRRRTRRLPGGRAAASFAVVLLLTGWRGVRVYRAVADSTREFGPPSTIAGARRLPADRTVAAAYEAMPYRDLVGDRVFFAGYGVDGTSAFYVTSGDTGGTVGQAYALLDYGFQQAGATVDPPRSYGDVACGHARVRDVALPLCVWGDKRSVGIVMYPGAPLDEAATVTKRARAAVNG